MRSHTDGSYCAASDSRVHVGLGEAAAIDGLSVIWPDGEVETFGPQPVDGVLTLRQGTAVRPGSDQGS